jgi:hypothetical protein
VLGRRLDDEIPIGQVIDDRGAGDPGQLLCALSLVEFAALNRSEG